MGAGHSMLSFLRSVGRFCSGIGLRRGSCSLLYVLLTMSLLLAAGQVFGEVLTYSNSISDGSHYVFVPDM